VLKEPELPYRKFIITLDRSGRELEEIIKSVNLSIESLKRIDEQDSFENFIDGKQLTHFKYELSPFGKKVATIGIEDLKMTSMYTIAFLQKIESIDIESHSISFRVNRKPQVLNQELKIFTVVENDIFETTNHKIVICSNGNVSIAVPISEENDVISFKKIDEKIPKLFCDFPLVGTEDYPIPFIINSPNFHPEETRDNIYLEHPTFETGKEVDENRSIIEDAVRLYYKLIDYAIDNNWGNIYILAQSLSHVKRVDLIKNEWFNKKIIYSLRMKILTSKIITNSIGEKVSILNEGKKSYLFFPKANKEDELKGVWDVSKKFQPKRIPSWEEVIIWKDIIWNECEKITLPIIAKWVEEQKNIATLANFLYEQADVHDWLNSVFSLVKKSNDCSSIEAEYSIFPNQNGDFVNIDSLFWEAEHTDETIKDILSLLGNDVRKTFLDSDIFYPAPPNRTRDITFLSTELHKCVLKELRTIPIESETTKSAFKKLLIWFKGKEELINDTFSNLYQLRHRLLDDNEVIDNLQKAEEIDELMEEFEVSDINELRKILIENKNLSGTNHRLEPFTKELLASLGVATIEEFNEAIRDKDLAQLFAHHSSPTVEMFQYAQTIIERAKLRVINHLKSLNEYDVSQAELIATTIYAGVTKQGKDIHIVVRPSDNREVILYYGSEKDTLDFEISELWVDNGKDAPRHVSFGKLLKDTGINRFPIN
jgi:hypothetical protein